MTTDVTALPARAGAQPEPTGPAPALPVPVAIGLATVAGGGLLLAFPPYDWWWLAPVAVGLLTLAVHRRRARAGAGLGAITGVVFFAPLLSWASLEVGYVPWLLLVAVQAGFLALLGAATGYLSPVVDRWRWSWPLLTAGAWVGQEALRSRVPFGGFPWGRLAFSQADSPLLTLAALGGAPLVTFAVALAGGLLAAALWRLRFRQLRPRRLAVAGALVAAAGVVVLTGYAVPLPAPAGPPVTVAFVQGNVPRLGLDFNAQRRAVLDQHVAATIGLAEQVAAGAQPQPDLVIWPENSSDIDPVRNRDAAQRISRAAAAIDAPILVGAGLRDPDGTTAYNVGLIWDPQTGPGEAYRKRHPVPFAEYLPMRRVVLPVARAIIPDPDGIALLRDHEGWAAGDEPGVLAMGPATIGNVICFEVAYDGLVRDTVTGGAQLLTVQTNNATFDEAEARQQLAMVRLRAVEHGRESLMASTVGISGFVGADGEVSDSTRFFTQDVRVRTLTLTRDRTPATVVGAWPELLLAGGAAGALVVAVIGRQRAERSGARGQAAGIWRNVVRRRTRGSR